MASACGGGLEVEELAHNEEAKGSIPATSKPFSIEPAIVKIVWPAPSRKRMEELITLALLLNKHGLRMINRRKDKEVEKRKRQ